MSKIPKTTQLGPYQIKKCLGQGGMGVVYQAEHQKTGQSVALKTVKGVHAGMLRSLRQEIGALARLSHPGIVRILEYGVSPKGLPWYAMEFLEGQVLHHWKTSLFSSSQPTLRTNPSPSSSLDADTLPETLILPKPLPPTSQTLDPVPFSVTQAASAVESQEALLALLSLVAKLCAPLAYLHGEGIVHRDLKPDNILIRFDGTPILMDFGIANLSRTESRRENLEVEQGVAGTAPYMSPEQIQGDPLDARSDLYALGVILFELLTGQRPFQKKGVMATLRAHLEEPIPLPSSLVPSLPKALDDLVVRLLAKERHERLGYAQDVALALERFGSKGVGFDLLPSPRSYLYRPRLSGRQKPLARLQQKLVKLKQGEGGLFLLGGESGVGKTRLAKAVAKEALQRQITILTGGCTDSQVKVPLQAFHKVLEAIEDHCRQRGKLESERILGKRGKVLALYRPSLATLPGQAEHLPAAELPLQAAKQRLFAYLGETLYAFLDERPHLLVLDDLQWADELSLDFLHFFRKGWLLPHFLWVLGLYRSEEITPSLERLQQHENTESILLSRLSEQDVGAVVGDMLGLAPKETPPLAFTRFLQTQSEGNPFFVAEYLLTAVQEEILFRNQTGHWQVLSQEEGNEKVLYQTLPLPKSLQELITHRLEGLSKAAREVLASIAVLGKQAPFALFSQMLSLSEEALEEALEELRKRHALKEEKTGVFGFAHDKLREVFWQTLPKETHTSLHRQAALALETFYAKDKDSKAAELSTHWEKAGVPEKAKPYYLRAARQAASLYNHQEAERFYRAYLALVETPTEESIAAQNELGEKILFVQGRREEARAEYVQATQNAQQAALPLLAAKSQLLLASVYRANSQVTKAQSLLESLLSLSQEMGTPHFEGYCLGNLAILYEEQSKFKQAKSLYEKALHIHQEVGDRHLEGNWLGNLAVLYQNQGDFTKAKSLYEKALRIHQEIGNRHLEGLWLGNLASLYEDQGDFTKAKSLYEKALHIHQEIGNRHLEGLWLSCLGELAYWTGNFEQAMQLCEQGETLLKKVGNKLYSVISLCVQGHIALAKGQSAETFLQETNTLAKEVVINQESALGKKLLVLTKAQQTFLQGNPLFRGQLLEDIPKGIRHFFVQSGQLSQEQSLLSTDEPKTRLPQ